LSPHINFQLKKVFKTILLNFIAKFVGRIKPFVYKSVYSSYQ